MSDVLTPGAPEAAPAVPSVEDSAPGDGTAVQAGSTGESDEWRRRFDGLMASSQKRETELRTQLEALTTRINSQETPPVADNDAVLEKLSKMEERALQAERKAALSEILARHPDAAPFADLIVADTPEDMENVAAAIAMRAQALKPVAETPPAGEGAPVNTDATPPAPEATPEVPVIGGTPSAPVVPTDSDAVNAALKSRSWSDYWAAKTGPAANANLG